MKQVKICGLFRPEDIEAVNAERPDYCGFIINFPKSHRNLSPQQVKELRKNLSEVITPVGVFVDEPVSSVAELVNSGTIAIPQLHGKEDNAYIAALRELLPEGSPVWQAVQVRSGEDLQKAQQSTADFVILDAGQGSGTVFDWSLLTTLQRPFGLAGGIGPANLPEALATDAALLDISGGAETDKKKDKAKIRQLIQQIRA